MINIDVLYSVAGVATQVLLSHRSADVLVDSGDGVVRDLFERRYNFDRLKAVLLTHEDFDHISGLYALLNFMKNFFRYRGGRDELVIVAPKPIHHVHVIVQPPLMYSAIGFPVRLVEAADGQELSIAGLTIRPFTVEHVKEGRGGAAFGGNLGYTVVDETGFRVVLSGDTRPCEALRREAEGADIAVIEATGEDGEWEKMVRQGHMTRSEAEEIGRMAKKVIYIHKSPPWKLWPRTGASPSEHVQEVKT